MKLFRSLGFALAFASFAVSQAAPQTPPGDDDLKLFAVHINRTPPQPWPGYGVYLGNGLVLTASHVPANAMLTKPHILIAGLDLPAAPVKQGSLETIDLTLLAVDQAKLPLRWRMSRMPLCQKPPYPGEAVVIATPEGTARSRILPPAAIPPSVRSRFDTLIGDVATTGNSGSGVFDAWRQCLLGIISRKITVGAARVRMGAAARGRDIAKYFVPVGDIKAFLPDYVSF